MSRRSAGHAGFCAPMYWDTATVTTVAMALNMNDKAIDGVYQPDARYRCGTDAADHHGPQHVEIVTSVCSMSMA
jgi:hypothetical protein